MVKKYRMLIAYDGTNYSGWQIQPNGITIQEEIEKALKTILKIQVRIQASGRTDQGVHAKGQVAHFEMPHCIDEEKVLLSLNGLLPKEIRIRFIEKVPLDFHAIYSARSKIYHYHLWLEPVIDPVLHPYRLHVRKPLDLKLMAKAAKKFVGKKDFSTFANLRGPGILYKNPIRRIIRLDMIPQEGGVRFEFEGDGFMYKMVRNIMGVLLEVGQKRRALESLSDLFAAKDRRAIGMPAPAHALFLQKVIY